MRIPVRVVIVAGGAGKRMGKNIPKQFLVVNQKPIIMHTLQRFLEVFPSQAITVTVQPDQEAKMLNFLNEYHISGVSIAYGGASRTESVRNSLQAIYRDSPDFKGFVLIHDAVRPFVSKNFLQSFVAELQEKKALITACPLKNSLRKITPSGTEAVNRQDYIEVQTPQGFLFPELYEAYANTSQNYFDDASLYESYYAKPVHYTTYIPENIKITTVVDLILAEYLSKNGF